MKLNRWLTLLSPLVLLACSKAPESNPYMASAPAEGVSQVKKGEAVYQRICAACHQLNGQGVPAVFPPLVGSEFVAATDPANLVRITLFGLQGPVTVKGAVYQGIMPPQAPLLKDEEIAAVLTYVRQAWGHTGSAVNPELVRSLRASDQRDTPWTINELPNHGK